MLTFILLILAFIFIEKTAHIDKDEEPISKEWLDFLEAGE